MRGRHPACSLPHSPICFPWQLLNVCFPLSSLSSCSVNVRVCVSCFSGCLCEGVHHSQSVKPDLWDAESWSVLFLLYSIIPTCLLWIHLFMPLSSMWSFLLSLCTGLLLFPHWSHFGNWRVVISKAVISARYCYKNIYLSHICLMLLSLMLVLYCCPYLWLGAVHHLRASLSCAGMQCLLLTSSAGTRTSWLLESLSHVLHRCLQSLFPHADTGR